MHIVVPVVPVTLYIHLHIYIFSFTVYMCIGLLLAVLCVQITSYWSFDRQNKNGTNEEAAHIREKREKKIVTNVNQVCAFEAERKFTIS